VSFALLRGKLRAVAGLAPGQPVPSPCNSVCRVDPASGRCEGCLRTLDEIAGWSQLGDAGKRQVWTQLAGRLAAAEETP